MYSTLCYLALTILPFSPQLLDKLDDGYRLEKPHVSWYTIRAYYNATCLHASASMHTKCFTANVRHQLA